MEKEKQLEDYPRPLAVVGASFLYVFSTCSFIVFFNAISFLSTIKFKTYIDEGSLIEWNGPLLPYGVLHALS